MKVKTFKQWFEDRGDEKLPENEISGEWFHTHRFPMVVSCCECGTTMALPFAYITQIVHLALAQGQQGLLVRVQFN